MSDNETMSEGLLGNEKKPELADPGKKAGLPQPKEKKLFGHVDEKKLLEHNTALEMKVKELEDRLLRLQADFDNYRKRAAKENERLRENASAESMLKLLPVVDEFDIAMSHVDKASHKEFKLGMELIFSKLQDMLRKEGVEPMASMGEAFDPYKHDALREGEGESGKVVEVVQKGYLFKGNVLRHAKVVVGKRKEGD
jgi:molecular chaperone GrpE